MTKTLTYPSAQIPGPPHISMDVPDDWEVLTIPGVQIAIAEPVVDGQFRLNVVVTVQRFAAGFTLEQAEQGLEKRKKSLPELEDLGTGELESQGRTWVASEYGYTQPGRPTVVQAARYCLVERGDVVDVVEVIGSCGAESADDDIELLRTIQDSLRVTEG